MSQRRTKKRSAQPEKNAPQQSRNSQSVAAQSSFYFSIAQILAMSSGAAALGHEIILSRRLIDLLGASNTSVSRVFGCFFLGLSIGAICSRRFADRLKNPWLAAGIAELGVALFVAPTFWIAAWTDWIWPMVGNSGLSSWSSALIKLFFSIAFVAPPAFCMGLFLPCLARAVLRDNLSLERHGVWLYALNTAGGVLGTILVSMVLIASVGMVQTVIIVICLNLAVGLVCILCGKSTGGVSPEKHHHLPSAPQAALGAVKGRWLIYLVSFVSGFGVLAMEMLALQIIALNSPLSYYATPTLLVAVILLLAVSAAMMTGLIGRWTSSQNLIGVSLLATALLVIVSPFWFRWLAPQFMLMDTTSLADYWWTLGLFSLVAFGPMILTAGLLFPSAAAWVSERGQDRYGVSLGRLLAINGLGGMIGAETVFSLVIPTFGIHAGVVAISLIYIAAAFVWGKQFGGSSKKAIYGLAGILLFAAGGSLAINGMYPHINFSGIAVLEEKGGREGVVSVIHSDQMGLRIAMSGHYILGGTRHRFDQERMAHLPMMLHSNPQKVGFLGLATGISAGAILEHHSVQSVQVAELAPLVVRAAHKYFEPFNHAVTTDPRVEIVTEDARIFVAANPNSFDLVIGDLFLPWAPGEARLYSLEHFRAVRKSLNPGGLYCQWLAAYQLNAEQLAVIQKTLNEVFPEVHLFRYNFDDLWPVP